MKILWDKIKDDFKKQINEKEQEIKKVIIEEIKTTKALAVKQSRDIADLKNEIKRKDTDYEAILEELDREIKELGNSVKANQDAGISRKPTQSKSFELHSILRLSEKWL